MDERERYLNQEELMRLMVENQQARIWTTFPGIVQSWNANANTLQVQPAFLCFTPNRDGTMSALAPKPMSDVPVVFPGGGGMTLTFPIEAGDEALVFVASRGIDGWFASGLPSAGNIPPPSEVRMHYLSDAFALVGLRSTPRKLINISTSSVQLRTDDGSAYYDFNPTTKAFKVVAPGGIDFNGVTIDSSGNLVSPATVTGQTEVVAGSGGSAVHLLTHTQPVTGGGTAEAPTPGS